MTRAARPWLWPLVPLYAAGAALQRRLTQPRWLGQPVLSVGSCSAGGAGKTPLVALLAQALAQRGLQVSILSRGYGRASTAIEQVDPNGDAARYGDEPLLLAQQTQAAVWVGADRYAAGQLAAQVAARHATAPLVHLLDDGLQHRRLGRDANLVLLTAADCSDALLPAGNLREPLARLCEADVVVLRAEELAITQPVAHRLAPSAALWTVRRRLVLPAALPSPVIAFCGIARPENFASMLAEAGCQVAALVAFADHQTYGEAQRQRLLQAAIRHSATGFVTTAKDAVKLTPDLRQQLAQAGPVLTAELTLELDDAARAVDALWHLARDRYTRRHEKIGA
ncbi:MAG: tetraacyldisaccharide 4'-kinase [Acidobacteriota bacterium]|nr:tetraacyldisaccharide 4'-kinase [Acidobacteriota bacterium]